MNKFWGEKHWDKFGVGLLALVVLSACKPNLNNTLRTRSSNSSTDTTVNTGQGYILADNPIILTGNTSLSPTTNLNTLTSVVDITTDPFLQRSASCYGLSYCFEVKANETQAAALQTSNGKWGFDTSSAEFLQVNTFYHVGKIFDRFVTNLDTNFSLAYNGSTPYYDSSLPLANQVGSSLYKFILSAPLEAYADCDYGDNAYFSSANNSLCFGYTKSYPTHKWAQDSSLIYHEAGHFIQYLQLNLRNYGLTKQLHLGNYYYDEAAAIGEGLSDYFSYYVNKRTHFAEWATGRVLSASRPISEEDSLHVSSLAKDPEHRLNYPDYLTYDPNDHTAPVEDIHYSGMIMSHYLVALTEDLMDKCALTKDQAQLQVMNLITETMAELGDLNAVGTVNGSAGRINLSSTYSYDWVTKVNPINYRSFTQTLAKFLYQSLGSAGLNRCNSTVYTKDNIETLIDQYGLLLFRTYNENRNHSDPSIPAQNNTAVTSTNRSKTTLIAKDLIKLDPTSNAATAYIIDKQATIQSGIAALQASGTIGSLSSQTPSDLGFNNGNGKVSPGEVVAIALNLYNNSNSTMGDVQVLASDWKNLGASGKPCIYPSSMANDSDWTTTAEGGEVCSSSDVTATSSSDFQPICVMQYNGTNSTSWVSQHSYRTKLALDSSLCLNAGDDRDCFIRAIKGADQANYSKLDPKKNWFQTLQDPNSSSAYPLGWGNVMMFEVSKHIPPGTVIDCRFRVRFTNCDDCYHDSSRNYYDYTDKDYNGPKPFKIIHLKMTIID